MKLIWLPCTTGFLIVLTIAASASAQLTEKQAGKEIRGEVKAEIRDTRTAMRAAGATLEATLNALTRDASDGTFGAISRALLQEALVDFQQDMHLARALGETDVVLLMNDVLPQLSPTQGMYPPEFYMGSQGALGQLDARAHRDFDKVLGRVDRQLRKLARALEKNGTGFTWRLQLPERSSFASYNPGSAPLGPRPIFISVVYAFSELAVADDGIVCVIGRAPGSHFTDIELRGGQQDQSFLETVTGQAESLLNLCFTAIPEGNYLIEVVIQGSGFSRQYSSLGVR